MSTGKIHLIRHAEGLHNLLDNTSLHDPSLTERAFYRAENLGSQFTEANSNTVGIIITSPLRRTIQTSLTAFPRILDKRYYPVGSGRGGAPDKGWEGVKLVLNPDLQEIDIAPANTGSNSQTLGSWFPELDFGSLPVKWYVKEGDWSPDQVAVSRRVIRIMRELEAWLGSLRNTERPDVVVVTHGGVIAKLVPGLVMPVASWKSFVLEKQSNGQLFLRAS
jgi:broad specificity phosphatase PhoE